MVNKTSTGGRGANFFLKSINILSKKGVFKGSGTQIFFAPPPNKIPRTALWVRYICFEKKADNKKNYTELNCKGNEHTLQIVILKRPYKRFTQSGWKDVGRRYLKIRVCEKCFRSVNFLFLSKDNNIYFKNLISLMASICI